jgi:ribosomal protein S18 acetylase RimI-like enzyme
MDWRLRGQAGCRVIGFRLRYNARMELHIRPAAPIDFSALEELVIACFEPITWQKNLDERFGPLNGLDWRERWRLRLAKIFATQEVLVGEVDGKLAAMASGTVDQDAALGFIDVLGVGRDFQGQGLGRQMLRAMMEHLKKLGCHYVNLDCLTDNDAGNALYQREGFEETARHIRWFRRL